MKIRNIIPVALGDEPADLLITGGRLLNVFTGEIEEGQNVAIYQKRIAGVGDYTEAREVIDAGGAYLVPGLIDAHLHIESSMLAPHRFAQAVLQRGTTTVVADPHEIANVMGVPGIEYMVAATEAVPLEVYIGIPSAVPATRFETSGAYLGTDDMLYLVDRFPRRIIALGEVMNYPGVLRRDRELITKIEILRRRYKKIDGHAPGVSGRQLNGYLCAFVRSDHECSTAEEAREKIARGMQVFIREGSAARNLDALIEAVTPLNHASFSLCTDDRDPLEIREEGHIDHLVRRAIARGLDPVVAIRMATINTAQHFDLRSYGAIAPSYKADLLLVDDLAELSIRTVIKDGRVLVSDGRFLEPIDGLAPPAAALGSFRTPDLDQLELGVPVRPGALRVIQLGEGTLLTREVHLTPTVQRGAAVADPERDLAKVVVVDRHRGTGYSVGFLQGLGLKRGAIATSVGHDAHNLCAAGMNDADVLVAARWVCEQHGGMVVVLDGEVLASLALPIAGLMSDLELDDVTAHLEKIRTALAHLGTEREVFMTLSFTQLAAIPTLRITDRGLVDVEGQSFVDLFVEVP
jgi:adenine deaminase